VKIAHRTLRDAFAVGLLTVVTLSSGPRSWAAGTAVDPQTPIGSVNGQPVTMGDLRAAAPGGFADLERETRAKEHDLTEKELKKLLDEKCLVLEAAAQKKTVPELLATLQPTPVTQADVDVFYEANKTRINRPKDPVVSGQISKYLDDQRRVELLEKLLVTLRVKYHADVLLEPIRAQVPTAGFPAKGSEAAPVTIVEFSDFQCPFCSRMRTVMDQVTQVYGGKVRLVFREFPLTIHPNAAGAAEAALCANAQGKFWEMHDAMFSDQAGLDSTGLKAKATKLGLDATTFNRCLDAHAQKAAVQTDLEVGRRLGVDRTPALFINGRYISGAVPFEQVAPLIDDELKRKGQPATAH
jgi:protein-disulfide isomerase